jgi:hypothetical protein
MSVQDMIDLLEQVDDKSIPFLVPIDAGFVNACKTDTGVALDDQDQQVFVAMPCFCHIEGVSVDVVADDFDINQN